MGTVKISASSSNKATIAKTPSDAITLLNTELLKNFRNANSSSIEHVEVFLDQTAEGFVARLEMELKE